MEHKTGYNVWIGGKNPHWHRTLANATKRAESSANWYYRGITQIIECKTSKLVWGVPQ